MGVSGAHFAILIASLLVTGMLGMFGMVREWWRAVTYRPIPALLFVATFITPFLGNTQGGNLDSYVPDPVRMVRLLIILLLFALIATRILFRGSCLTLSGANALWMLVYALLAMSSSIYSIEPRLSLWKGFEVLTLVLVGISLAEYLRSFEDIRWLLNLISLLLLFLAVSILAGVLIARSEAFPKFEVATGSMAFAAQGVFPLINANSVSQIGAFLMTFALIFGLNGGRGRETGTWLVFFIGVAIIILGHGRTSLFSALVAMVMIMLFGRHLLMAAIALLIGAPLYLFTSTGAIFSAFVYRGQSSHVFNSMSGRTFFWEKVWKAFSEAPLAGHGFYAGQRVGFGVSSVDNTYLEVALGLGTIGLIVFVIPVLCVGISLLRNKPRRPVSKTETAIWLQLVSLYIILIVRSFSGPSFQVLHHNLVIFMVMLVCTAAFIRLRRNQLSESEVNQQVI